MRCIFVTLAASAATLLKPYSIGMWRTVAHALGNPYTRIAIGDWQPLVWSIIGQWQTAPFGVVLYAVVIAVAIGVAASFAAAPSAEDVPLIAIVAAMAVATLLSARNLALVAITSCAPLTRHWAALIRRSHAQSPRLSERWGPSGTLAALTLALAMVLDGHLMSHRLSPDRSYPAAALAFMRQHHLRGNLLAEFGWGEYVIWYAVPEDKVFIDGRYDTVYPLPIIRDCLDFHFARPRDALLYSRANAKAARLYASPFVGIASLGGFP